MKKIIMVLLVLLTLFACGKEDVMIEEQPSDKVCKLSEKESFTLFPNPQSSSQSLSYYQDSVVEISQYGTDMYKTVYLTNNNDNTITFNQTDEEGVTNSYGTYYLNADGMRDSSVSYRGFNNTVNSKLFLTRNASDQIIREIIEYNNYGYDTRHTYDSNGNIAYSIYLGYGTVSYNDSLVYEYDMDRINRGAPTYPFQELNGIMAANHITKISHINRNTGEIWRVRKYVQEDFDNDGNPTKTYYESDNDFNGVFDADYRYEYTYSYTCE